jgi:hypothetical protein
VLLASDVGTGVGDGSPACPPGVGADGDGAPVAASSSVELLLSPPLTISYMATICD